MFLPPIKISFIRKAIIFAPLPEWKYYSKKFEEGQHFSWLNINFKFLRGNNLLVGPVLSSPALALLIEFLKEKGVEKLLFLGWAGKTPFASIVVGELLLSEKALSLEGTSKFYFKNKKIFSTDKKFFQKISNLLREFNIFFRIGTILTVDAPQVVEKNLNDFKLQLMKVQAMDMETSALYALSNFYKIKAVALHFITDELGKLSTLRPEKMLTQTRENLFFFFRNFLENDF